jgi:hypothetical protein
MPLVAKPVSRCTYGMLGLPAPCLAANPTRLVPELSRTSKSPKMLIKGETRSDSALVQKDRGSRERGGEGKVWTHTGGIGTGEGDGPVRFAICRRIGGRGFKPRLRRSALVGRASTEGITEAMRSRKVRPRQVNLCITGMM